MPPAKKQKPKNSKKISLTIKSRYVFLFWIFLILSAIGFFFPDASMETASALGTLEGWYLDKVIHFIIFILLTYLGLISCLRAQDTLLAFLITYALFSEVMQELFVEGRRFEWFDIAADILGIIIGVMFFSSFAAKNILEQKKKRLSIKKGKKQKAKK